MIARLRALPASQWRYELLFVAILFMEGSLLAGWFLLLNPFLGAHSAGAAWLGVTGLMALMYLITRLLLSSGLRLAGQRLALAGVLVLALVLTLWLHVYGRAGWLSAWLRDWGVFFITLRAGPVASLALLLVCWRGVALAYRDVSFWSVGLSFRLGVLLLAVAGFLWPSAEAGRLALVVAYFFFGVIAIALARVDELASREPGADQPFNLSWGAIVLGAAVSVAGLGWAFGQFYSPAGLARLLELLWPTLEKIGAALFWLIEKLLLLLLPLLDLIFRAVGQLIGRLNPRWVDIRVYEPPEMPPTPVPTGGEAGVGFPWQDLLRWAGVALLLGVALTLVILSLRRLRQRRRPDSAGEQHAMLPASAWADDLLDGLRQGAERLADALGLLGRFGVGRRLYAAISIRYIYANVTRLAAQRGRPRPPATTPYEYLPILRQVFAGVEADLERITEAYVGVHYGEAPATLKELNEIRLCWERVREAEAREGAEKV